MAKIEIDLTEEQLEKVKELEEHNLNVGDAIDMLFEVKDKALFDIETFDEDKISFFAKVKGSRFDVDKKAQALDENYSEQEKDYTMQVKEIKGKISWAKDIFNF